MKHSSRSWKLAAGIAAALAVNGAVMQAPGSRFQEVGIHPDAAAQPTDWGRTLTALAAFNGKIYAGYGDWNENTGPITLRPFDPATDTFGSGKLSASTEAIHRFRKIDGKLYGPDHDPLGTMPGGYAVGTANGATETWIHTAPVPATHVFDVESFGGDLWMCGSYGHNATVWRGSAATGWETMLSVPAGNSSRCYGLGVFRGKLYTVVNHESTAKSRVFDGTSWSDGPILLPNGGRGIIRAREFADKLVYLGAGSSLTTFNVRIGADLGMAVRDYEIYGDRLYTLGNDGMIKCTTDLVEWETIAVAPEGSRSLAILNYHLYVGATDAKLHRFVRPVAEPPDSIALQMNAASGGGLCELTLKGRPDTGYEFRSSPTLDFDPGALVENLTQGAPRDPGSIGGANDSVLTTDSNGEGTARMALAGPSNFVFARDTMPLAAVAERNPITLPETAVLCARGTPDPGLIYTWSLVSGPDSVSFSPNASTDAHTCTATFDREGTYTLRVANSAGHTVDLDIIVKPDPGPIALPGILEAENYAPGGEGIGYHDTTPGNSGGVAAYSDDVDVAPCWEGGYNVGWIREGEWLAYNVQPVSTALYQITARVASAQTADKTFHIELDGSDLTGPIVFNTGGAGWQAWRDVNAGRWQLAAGLHRLRIVMDSGSFNLNHLDITILGGQ